MVITFLLGLLVGTTSYAESRENLWFEQTNSGVITVKSMAFISSTCSYCKNLKAFTDKFAEEHPWFKVHYYFIDKDKQSLETFNKQLQANQQSDFKVPSLYFCDSRWVGFSDNLQSMAMLSKALIFCHQQLQDNQTLLASTVTNLRKRASTYSFGSEEGIQLFNNPLNLLVGDIACSILVIIAILALLKFQPSNYPILILFLYALTNTVMHILPQLNSSYYYDHIYLLRLPVMLVGIYIGFMIINPRHSSNMRSLLVSLLLAISLQAYIQLEIPNQSLIFEHWLASTTTDNTQYWKYLIAYNSLYGAFIGLLAFVLHRLMKRVHTSTQLFEVFSTLFLSVLALCFIVYPYILGNYYICLFGTIGLSLVSRLVMKKIESNI